MKTIEITKNDANQRLDKFLGKFLKNAPRSLIYKYIRTNKIKVNKKKPDIAYLLAEGDILTIFIKDEDLYKKDEFKKTEGNLSVVFEDSDLLIIDKPPGIACQPDDKHKTSLVDLVKTYLYEKGEFSPENEHSFSPAICNRLDVNTGGIVIAAKNAETLRNVNEKIRDDKIEKYYYCVVNGKPPKNEDTLTGEIVKDKVLNKSKIVKSGGIPVKTGYKLITINDNVSLLEVRLFTGKSHQIRAHMASIGCPIVGDKKYGGGGNYPHQALYAYKIILDGVEYKTEVPFVKDLNLIKG